MSKENSEKIEYLIADTTAFINAVPLNEYATNVFTVPDVIAEVRNRRQIRRLCVLPYNLEVREPRPESVKYCVDFAKKTGDYASLSGIDIKVIALTYELEVDLLGTNHLRKEPVVSTLIASKEKPLELQDNITLPGWYNNSDNENENDDNVNYTSELEYEHEQDLKENENGNKDNERDPIKDAIERSLKNNDCYENIRNEEEELQTLFEKLLCDASTQNNDTLCDYILPQAKQLFDENEDDVNNSQVVTGKDEKEICDNVDNEDSEEEEENAGDWITPKNIAKAKKFMEDKTQDDITPRVACMSTDFAIQNTLKQMNLNVVALNGRIIKHLRTYILRCYACFKTTSIVTKIFCPNCGNKTLKRVAVSLDENGKQVIHINLKHPLTAKYKNQSLPLFKGGKHSHNPILFEDQPMPRQMPSRVAKTKTNALDEDYIAGFSPFALRDVDSKSAMLRAKGHIKEWSRNTKYEEERRRRHYNRFYK